MGNASSGSMGMADDTAKEKASKASAEPKLIESNAQFSQLPGNPLIPLPSWAATLSEEVTFMTQTLEGKPSPFTSCSALSVHIKADGKDGVLDISFRVTSRCGSKEGEIVKQYTAVGAGDCLHFMDSEQALAGTIGQFPGHGPEALWMSGVLSLDIVEWWKYDEKKTFIGVLCPGETEIEIFGAAQGVAKGSDFMRAKAAWHMFMILADPLFEANAVVSFFLNGKQTQAVVTLIMSLISSIFSLMEWKRSAHLNGYTMLEFWKFNQTKSLYGGILSHNMMVLKTHDMYDYIVMYYFVASGIMLDTFSWSTMVSVCGIILVASEHGLIIDAFTEHYAQASRMKFVSSALGARVQWCRHFASGMSNPVLLLAIISHLIYEDLEDLDDDWYRRRMVAGWVAMGLLSWVAVAIVIPSCVFLGSMPKPESLTEVCMDLLQCNAAGEAPITQKRTKWSPSFHVYRCIIQVLWKAGFTAFFFYMMPGAWEHFNEHAIPMINSDNWKAHEKQTPHTVLMGLWIAGAIAQPLIDILMFIMAQCGSAFPGMRFGTPGWPVLGVAEFTKVPQEPSGCLGSSPCK